MRNLRVLIDRLWHRMKPAQVLKDKSFTVLVPSNQPNLTFEVGDLH
jgi:hypothetical protein